MIDKRLWSDIMLSLARYRYAVVAQLTFLGVHGLGLLLGAIFTSKTPDLYENNAHNKIGWIVTLIVLAQTVSGVIKLYESGTSDHKVNSEEKTAFLPISHETMAYHELLQGDDAPGRYRYSRDSGQGTEIESPGDESCVPLQDDDYMVHFNLDCPQHIDGEKDFNEKQTSARPPAPSRLVSYFSALMPECAISLMDTVYDFVNGLILILGFVAITTGIVVYGGILVSSEILLL